LLQDGSELKGELKRVDEEVIQIEKKLTKKEKAKREESLFQIPFGEISETKLIITF